MSISRLTKSLWYCQPRDTVWYASQAEQLKRKLSSSELSTKLRYYVRTDILRTVNFSIFSLVMWYGLQVRRQKQSNFLYDIGRPQIKAAKIMCFNSKYKAVNQAYKKLKIVKFRYMLDLNNCQFVKLENYQ